MTTTDDRRGQRERRPGAGAVSATGQRHHGLGWLPWLLLGLLALLALLTFLLVRNVGDEGDRSGVDTTNDRAGSTAGQSGTGQTGTGQAAVSPTTGPAGTGDTAAGAAGAAALTSGGKDLLAASAGKAGLEAYAGKEAVGRAVEVQSVVANEGFWVGSSERERVFVFLTPEARNSEGESPFQVKAGQQVNLTGSVDKLPSDLTPFGVDKSEGADQLRRQGSYVKATKIELHDK
ncbi:MAG TPA: hypothetical protein VEZ46_07715 [Mycobacteriales bacterium]|nr:hypothetical protein [Mycobacteriales bacterium]